MNKYIHGRTCVYNINYHIVWCVKYRKKVLSADISNRLYELINDIGSEKGFSVVTCKVGDNDHVRSVRSYNGMVNPGYMMVRINIIPIVVQNRQPPTKMKKKPLNGRYITHGQREKPLSRNLPINTNVPAPL